MNTGLITRDHSQSLQAFWPGLQVISKIKLSNFLIYLKPRRCTETSSRPLRNTSNSIQSQSTQNFFQKYGVVAQG